jgi:hypothetical protein
MVFGNVGGMASFLGLVFKFLVGHFADLELRAEIVKHLFKQENTTKKTKETGLNLLKGEN